MNTAPSPVAVLPILVLPSLEKLPIWVKIDPSEPVVVQPMWLKMVPLLLMLVELPIR